MSAWLCGMLLLSLRTVLAWRHAQALAREGTRPPEEAVARALARMMERTRVSRPVRLLESVAVEVPTVVTLEQLRVSVPVPALAANGGSLLSRIQRLLAVPEGGAPLHPWKLVGALAAAMLVVVLGAARQAQATGATSEPPVQEQAEAPLASYEIPSFQEGLMTRPMKLSGDIPQIPKSMLPPLAPPGTHPWKIRMRYVFSLLITPPTP